jgi:hypothetical protein
MKAAIVRGLVAAVLLGVVPGATAKTLDGRIANSDRPNGTVFTTCSGALVWAQANGFDSNGNTVCSQRATQNNIWLTNNSCPSTAVKQSIQLRVPNGILCSSNQIGWGTGHVCWVTNAVLRPNGGSCVNHGAVYAFSNATP